jgi:hypothetical protein
LSAAQVVNTILSVLEFLVIIPGLWVAGSLLPRLLGWIRPVELRERLARPFPRLVIWLALGALLTFPLLDLLGLLENWQALVQAPTGSVNTAFGSIPSGFFSYFSIVVMVLAYLLIWWAARRAVPRPVALGTVEWAFLILTAASLIYRFLSRGILGFLQLPLPSGLGLGSNNLGIWGVLLTILVALALLAAIVIGVNMALAGEPLKDES